MSLTIPEWNDDYSIGIPDVDYQHKYFLSLIHRFYERYKDGLSKELIDRHLKEILMYAQFHFFSEENMMLIYGYDKFHEHHELHNDLADHLATKLNNLDAQSYIIDDLIQFMVDWFINHTVKEDKNFGEFLVKHQSV